MNNLQQYPLHIYIVGCGSLLHNMVEFLNTSIFYNKLHFK